MDEAVSLEDASLIKLYAKDTVADVTIAGSISAGDTAGYAYDASHIAAGSISHVEIQAGASAPPSALRVTLQHPIH